MMIVVVLGIAGFKIMVANTIVEQKPSAYWLEKLGGKREPKLRVLSMGWGVQSFTLAAMSALGELPKLDLIIHADTGWESQATYEFADSWLPWLRAHSDASYISACSLSTRNPIKPASVSSSVHLPAFLNGRKGVVQLNRQCTSRWKIAVVRQLIRQELDMRSIKPSAGCVEQWLGISWDEYYRAKNSEVKYISIRHPFLEKATRMTRSDCIKWLIAHGFPIPKKSSCYICPYHNDQLWADMKQQNDTDWKQAVEFDTKIRHKSTQYEGLYIHRSAKPLEQAVKIAEDSGYTQPGLIGGPGCDSAGYCWD